ncbi:MAG TPA: hypothetical protein VN516_02310, partial [Candidatus Baltobacteraceae bacterium]|nr:hypothetical protein [Candidatus Baltobacteraceae bacterium]
MLYERWKQISTARRNEIALRDFASGKRWTFAELFAAGENEKVSATGTVFPQGHSPEFIFQLLAAWRENKIACPLEIGQNTPLIQPSATFSPTGEKAGLRGRSDNNPPPPIIHFKLTSATTGNSRLVAFTAEQLAADAENIVATMGLRADWPNLGVISLAHS